MSAGSLVVAYHGCDVTLRDDLVTGKIAHLNHSNNKYDWLGPGAYFFENDLERALIFANASADAPEMQYSAQPITTPSAVGVILRVRNWIDMTNQDGLQLFREADEVLINSLVENRSEVPKNSPAHENDVDILHRARDRAVFKFIHEAKPGEFDAVRGAFAQGDQVSVNSGFRLRTHVQIALKNNKCVLGWFLPPDTKLLSENEYSLAKDRLSAAKAAVTARKKRVRA